MSDDATLARYRDSIDNIDAALVFMLAERFKITQAVGEYKAKVALPPADPDQRGSTDRPPPPTRPRCQARP